MFNGHAFGQVLVEFCGQRFDVAGHLNGVGSGLFDHANAYHGNAIASEQGALFNQTQFDASHITQSHQVTIFSFSQYQLGKVLWLIEIAADAGFEQALIGFQTASW